MNEPLNVERHVLPEEQRNQVAQHLQANLLAVIDLSLQLKQIHWNLVGPRFQSFHEQLDVIIEEARAGSDEIAERITTLGLAADGRAESVTSASALPKLEKGQIRVEEGISATADRLLTLIRTLRTAIDALGDLDPISEDLLIGISASMEKHLWMVQSQEK